MTLSFPLEASRAVMARKGIFKRKPPRKIISLVSSRALPSEDWPEKSTRHLISWPIQSPFCLSLPSRAARLRRAEHAIPPRVGDVQGVADEIDAQILSGSTRRTDVVA